MSRRYSGSFIKKSLWRYGGYPRRKTIQLLSPRNERVPPSRSPCELPSERPTIPWLNLIPYFLFSFFFSVTRTTEQHDVGGRGRGEASASFFDTRCIWFRPCNKPSGASASFLLHPLSFIIASFSIHAVFPRRRLVVPTCHIDTSPQGVDR